METALVTRNGDGQAALGRDDSYGPGLTLDDFRTWRDSLNGNWMTNFDDGTQGGSYEGGLDDQQRFEEDLYFQHFTIESPGGKLAVKTGSAPADADAAIESITPTDIQVRVRPARNRDNHKKRADRIAKFGRGVLAEWRKHKDLFRLVSGNMAIRRVGVMRVLYDERLWPPYPPEANTKAKREEFEWRHRKFPIILESRNPRLVRWHELDNGELAVVVEHYATTVAEARIAFGRFPKTWGILAGQEPNQIVWVDDIWIGRQRAVLVANEPILPGDGIEEHGYRRPPYIIVPFSELPFDAMGRKYRGMLSNASGLYEIESQALTMHVWQLAWNAWRTWIGHFNDPNRDLNIVPGKFIDVNPALGESIQMLEGEPVPPELLQTANIISAMLQRNGVSQGPSTQEGTRSAQQVWAIQALRQQKVEPGKRALQLGTEQALTIMAEIIVDRFPGEKITLPVPGKDEKGDPYGEITITSADLDGYEESFSVTFGRRLDPAMLEQATKLMALWANKWMPYLASVELSGMTDSPEEWVGQRLLEDVDNLDFMKEAAAYDAIVATYGGDENDWRVQEFRRRMQAVQPQQTNVGQRGPAGVQPTAMPAGPSPAAARPMTPQGGRGRMAPAAPANVRPGGPPGQTGV